MDIGAVIRDARLRAGVSQATLAFRAGTTQSALSRIETGQVSPTFETVERFLLAVGAELHVEAVPRPPAAAPEDLAAAQRMTPGERVAYALASSSSLEGLLGAVRHR